MQNPEDGKQTADGKTAGGLFLGITKLHFVGIGGAGMRSIAEILAKRGFRVSGTSGGWQWAT